MLATSQIYFFASTGGLHLRMYALYRVVCDQSECEERCPSSQDLFSETCALSRLEPRRHLVMKATTDLNQYDSFGGLARLDCVTGSDKDCARLVDHHRHRRGALGSQAPTASRLHEQPMVASPPGIGKVRHDSPTIPLMTRHFHLCEGRKITLCAKVDVILMSEIGPSVCERISRHVRIRDKRAPD